MNLVLVIWIDWEGKIAIANFLNEAGIFHWTARTNGALLSGPRKIPLRDSGHEIYEQVSLDERYLLARSGVLEQSFRRIELVSAIDVIILKAQTRVCYSSIPYNHPAPGGFWFV